MGDVDERYIGGEYLVANQDWHEGDAQWKASQVLRMIDKHGISHRSICDVGCGTGGVLDELRLLLAGSTSLVGYEPSSQAALRRPANRQDVIEFVEGGPDTDGRRFDLLLALDVFEHVEDYYGFLRMIRAKASHAIFHVPMDITVTTVLWPGPVLRSYEKVGHVQHFTRTLALQALRHSGYEIIDSWHTFPGLDQPATGRRARFARTTRRLGAKANIDLAARIITGFPLLVLARTQGLGGACTTR